jgi:hypothetical protein
VLSLCADHEKGELVFAWDVVEHKLCCSGGGNYFMIDLILTFNLHVLEGGVWDICVLNSLVLVGKLSLEEKVLASNS